MTKTLIQYVLHPVRGPDHDPYNQDHHGYRGAGQAEQHESSGGIETGAARGWKVHSGVEVENSERKSRNIQASFKTLGLTVGFKSRANSFALYPRLDQYFFTFRGMRNFFPPFGWCGNRPLRMVLQF